MKNERLISAEKLVINLAKKNRFGRIEYDDIMAVIAEAPTVEVVHAEWRSDGFCTNCNNRAEIQSIGFNCTGGTRIQYKRTRFCSECGAKMDGDRL